MLLKKTIHTVFVRCWCFPTHPPPGIFGWLGVCRSLRRTGLRAATQELVQIVALAEGLSGRAMRKLPFRALAFFVHVRQAKCLPAVRNSSSVTFVLFCFVLFCFVLFWFGLVWFGSVRFGSVRFGLVWFGLVWFGFGLVWFGLICSFFGFSFDFGCIFGWFCYPKESYHKQYILHHVRLQYEF